MKELIDYMTNKFGMTPKDAMSLWNMMVIDGKKKGVDMTKIPSADLIKFVETMMAQNQPSRSDLLNNMNKGKL